MGSVVNLECKQAKTKAGSGYLNLPLRTEAEVISLRDRMQAQKPVCRPCDSEPESVA